MEILNLLGQTVLTAKNEETIDINHLEKGVYFLMVSNKNGLKAITKVVKE